MEPIRIARTDDDIAACFDVMRQLRPHLAQADFVSRIRVQNAGGFQLAYLAREGKVCAVAGFRLLDNLAQGRVLYVDDLVTDSDRRSQGCGAAMLEWLAARARDEQCSCLELDSGVHRFDAHRFYFTRRMFISSYHFRLKL